MDGGRRGRSLRAWVGLWAALAAVAAPPPVSAARPLLFHPQEAVSPGAVQGRVRDAGGIPVYAAAVRLLGPGEALLTETDRLGHFRVEGVSPGRYRLEVIRLGFETETRAVEVGVGETVDLAVTLRSRAVEVEGVAVEAERSRRRARFEEEAGLTAEGLEAEELKLIPGLAEADPLRAVEVLPGVVSTSDFSSAFNVRGGSADQNLILLDGVPVFNPFHLGGLFSVFNADMVARAELRSGGFAPEYGGRVSSVLTVDSDPGTGEWAVDGGVSALAARVAVAGGLPQGAASTLGLRSARWRLSGRRSYFDQLLRPFFDFPYHLTDLQGVFEGWTAGGNRWSVSGYTGSDVLDLTRLDDEDFPLRIFWDWGNDALGGRWTHPRRGGGVAELRAAVSVFSTGLGFPDFQDTAFRSRVRQATLAGELEGRPGGGWTLRGGASADALRYDNLAVSGGTRFAGGEGSGWLLGGYGQAEWRFPGWILQGGLRLDGWRPDPGEAVLVASPRASLKRFFAGGEAAVKASAGRYTQFLHSIRDEELPVGLDVWVLAGARAPHVVSEQIQAGVEGYPADGWFVSVEGYWRRFDGVVTNNLAEDPNDPSDDLLPGEGTSYGMDLLVRRDGAGVNGWATLSWLRARRTFPDFRSGVVPAPDLTYPPIFDRRVDLDVVLRRSLPWGVEAGLRWNLGSGLPFTRPLGSFAYFSPQLTSGGRFVWQGDRPGGQDDDGPPPWAVVLGPRNGQRYPAYHRLDVGFRRPVERDWGRLVPYVNLLNAYNRRNVLFYFYEYEERPPVRAGISMFPLLPTVGVEVSF